ncbi:hypothetical protein [Parachlamydia sp. AcF125]|uniref:hypothetical protein n=1 Tax=Parachlamydia sp. AcF125 TaxID=2795736 RepID=UPI001BC92E76|nr:hypothetical protein [Parachlamydia sp. AcF125]MBS4168769.1 hypothetical protein [Parachlamydia sp. AcF125]
MLSVYAIIFYFALVAPNDVILFSSAILGVFMLLIVLGGIGIWISRQPDSVSPYSGLPLRYARDLSLETKEKIVRYLYSLHEYDNRIFEFSRAAFCRETGRIFPNSVTWFGKISLDWTFLKKRYPGNYVSWGSLTKTQQEIIRDKHTTLDGFQTEHSCPHPAPRAITPEYAFSVPGPLYADVNTYILIGWKEIPSTGMEVLIVQKPKALEIKVLPEDT